MKHKEVQPRSIADRLRRVLLDMMPLSFRGKLGLFLRRLTGSKRRADLGVNAYVSHKEKFLFIGIPKNAQTSTMRFLKVNSYKLNGEALALRYPLGSTVCAWVRDYYSFIIIRHPVDRILSCYRNKIANQDRDKTRIVDSFSGLSYRMGFLEFLQWLNTEEGSDSYADRHWVSQYQFCMDGDLSLENEFSQIVRIEDCESLLDDLAVTYGLDRDSYCRHNESRVKSDNIVITDEMVSLIKKRYSKDFEFFEFL